ncbi:low molecular weight protein-tyrosine-phosphatase [Lactococcus allomyrinae]|uniref:protein-tyrosine-phosphatase n=1 Tax=Lactococcus allomyrinae TaxID=2419773 RepID=A0A387BFB6_9LACT|nr:low molecular weight protein-tyrosine-phosphatase [Lactococcus allomyrinae]AYG01288.1 low molecular weight phosphotyrosine protein phosphatase [Lactococcus allomyrinae]
MEKILFVCLGNICRSPMAEFVMKDLVLKAGRNDEFHIESRATSSWEHGNPIHPGTKNIFVEKNIKFDNQKVSQQISKADFECFDYIIAMDDSNVDDLKKVAPVNAQNKITMLLDDSVPDPWHTGNFEETYRLISRGCKQLLS